MPRLEVLRPVLADPAARMVPFGAGAPTRPQARPGRLQAQCDRRWSAGTVPLRPCWVHGKAQIGAPFCAVRRAAGTGKGDRLAPRGVRRSGPSGDLDIDLVTIGKGELASLGVQKPPAGRVIDLGFVSDEERNNAFAAATAYIQPSRMESFSRTIMEAWLAGTPVIGLAESDVVAWHCGRSGGGLMFSDAAELASQPPLRRLQAGSGHRDGRGRPVLRARELHVAYRARPHGGELARRSMTARKATPDEPRCTGSDCTQSADRGQLPSRARCPGRGDGVGGAASLGQRRGGSRRVPSPERRPVRGPARG